MVPGTSLWRNWFVRPVQQVAASWVTDEPMGYAPRSQVLRRSGALQPRSLTGCAVQRGAEVRILPLRWRLPHVHRRLLCCNGSSVSAGHNRAKVSDPRCARLLGRGNPHDYSSSQAWHPGHNHTAYGAANRLGRRKLRCGQSDDGKQRSRGLRQTVAQRGRNRPHVYREDESRVSLQALAGFFAEGGHVESRTTNSGSTMTCLEGG